MPTLAENRKARHDYSILEKFEAGLVLTGPEVKSIKNGRANLQGAFVIPKGNELWLTNMHVAPYPPAKREQVGYNPERDRKLLLASSELGHLMGKLKEKGLTLVPLSLYTAHRFIKVELGLGRGKTKYDKRFSLRQRETEREIRRSLKR
jgi:SsrA-binding protein